jgi:DNA-binding MarR family transcriptional regulator
MKRKAQGVRARTSAAGTRPGRRSSKAAKPLPTGSQLEKVLSLIRAHPGIRPSEINRLLNLEQSDGVRNTLIRRGLIRKEKNGSATRYYVV